MKACSSMARGGTKGDIPQGMYRCCRKDCDRALGTDQRHLFLWMSGRSLCHWHLPCDNTQGTIPTDNWR